MGAQFSNICPKSEVKCPDLKDLDGSTFSRTLCCSFKHARLKKKQKKPMQMLENLRFCAGHDVQKLPQIPREAEYIFIF